MISCCVLLPENRPTDRKKNVTKPIVITCVYLWPAGRPGIRDRFIPSRACRNHTGHPGSLPSLEDVLQLSYNYFKDWNTGINYKIVERVFWDSFRKVGQIFEISGLRCADAMHNSLTAPLAQGVPAKLGHSHVPAKLGHFLSLQNWVVFWPVKSGHLLKAPAKLGQFLHSPLPR